MPLDRANRFAGPFLAGLSLVAIGCAGPNAVARDATRIEFVDVAQGQPEARRMTDLPFVLHVVAGQVIPIDWGIDSSLFSVEGGPARLVAQRDFYVLFRADGPPLLSEDGVEFEDRPPNAFRLGLRARRDEPTTIEAYVSIRPAP